MLIEKIFAALCDGESHSGNALARRFKVSRSAVWKCIGALRSAGAGIESVPRRGYRLQHATEPLSRASIERELPATLRERLRHGEVRWRCESTNAELLNGSAPAAGRWDYLLCEVQTAGRGRRRRPWFAPPGGALCLSLAWSFRSLPREAPALPLAMGVSLLATLAECGVRGLQLKWPNDLLLDGRKLAGILIEMKAEAAGPALAVIGVGLNVALPPALRHKVLASGTAATDLASAGCTLPRNVLAGRLIAALAGAAQRFEDQGFAPFAAAWRGADALAGKAVLVSDGAQRLHGHARGIDAHGALCVHTANGLVRVTAGDVSVRLD